MLKINTRSDKLKTHFEINHEGVRIRHACYECEYVATRTDHLKKHVENQHNKVRYSCSDCEFVATRADNLKIHVARYWCCCK